MKGIPVEEIKQYSRQASAESAVLLKNENDILPIKAEDTIAFFGRTAVNYYRSGTGSGGNVNVTYETNVFDGFKSTYPWVKVDTELLAIYEEWIKEHPFDNGTGEWASEPWHQVEMILTPEQVKASAARANKAYIVIGRTAGEDKDNSDTPGSYRLTADEKHMVELVTGEFEHCLVIFNVSGIMDTAWVNAAWCHGHIDGILYCWQGGPEGGNALADVLAGGVSPSGHLTDTICYRLSDYPTDANHGDFIRNYYEEDIYVGYRYFESFNKEAVMYPFGFGLSYTSFEISDVKAEITKDGTTPSEKGFAVSANITNTGNYKGKAVLQAYLSAPCGKLGRPAKELIGFKKTKELAPGEVCRVVIEVCADAFKTYDDSGVTGNKSCYVLEEGDYRIFVGSSVSETEEAKIAGKAALTVDKCAVVETLERAMAPVEGFARMKASAGDDGALVLDHEEVPTRDYKLAARIQERIPSELPAFNGTCTLQEVKNKKNTLEEFVGQLSLQQLAILARGEGMSSSKVTPGTASIFGGVSDDLMKLGVPAVCCADGPSGIHMEKHLKASQMPIGTALACTWNPDLVETMYGYIGEEMKRNDIDCLLGPGINIHRHPLCGRNFEYYSEDPYVAGVFAIAAVKGIASRGGTAVIKHCCANSQEVRRHTVNSVVSERALREIYLKPFEMAVKIGKANSIMTSYNVVNGNYTATSYDLTTTIIRKEWGFEGMIMTDWWSRLNDVEEGGELSFTDFRSMVRAQNDVYMIVNNNAAATNAKGDNIEESVAGGKLTKAELQRNAMNILGLILRLPAMDRPIVLPPAMPFKKYVGELSGKNVVSIEDGNIKINDENIVNQPLFVEVKEEADYIINVGVSSTAWELAQVLSTLYIGGEVAGDIQTNGTGGKLQELLIARAHLEPGVYELKVEHVKPRLDVQYVRFDKR